MIIAFTGPDGSGKSTLLKSVRDYYRRRGIEAKIQDEFDFVLLKFARKLTKGGAEQKFKNSRIIEGNEGDFKSNLLGSVYAGLVMTELFAEAIYYRVLRPKKILLRDRYAFDFMISFLQMNLPGWTIKAMKSFPRPQVNIFVEVPMKTAVIRMRKKRKFTFDNEYYQKLYKLYRNNKVEQSFITVSNSGDSAATMIFQALELRERIMKLKIIAISGLDGAGKSTTINNLIIYLDKLNIKHRSIHFYYNYLIIKLIKRIKQKNTILVTDDDRLKGYKKSIEAEEKHLANGKPRYWKMYVLLDAYMQYLLNRIIFGRRLLIFDRFFHDYLVSFDFLNVPHDKKQLLRFFPKPDRYFLLIADYNVLHERKPEHTLEFFKICHAKYSELARNTEIIPINSGENSAEQVKEEILKCL